MIEAFEIGVSLALGTNEAQDALADLERQLSRLDQTFSQTEARVSGLQASVGGLSGSASSSRVDSLQTLGGPSRWSATPALQSDSESRANLVLPEDATDGTMLWGLPGASWQNEPNAGAGSAGRGSLSTVALERAWPGPEGLNQSVVGSAMQAPEQIEFKTKDSVLASDLSGVVNRLEGALAWMRQTDSRQGAYSNAGGSDDVERAAIEHATHSGWPVQVAAPAAINGGSAVANGDSGEADYPLPVDPDETIQSVSRRDYAQPPGPLWGLGGLVAASADAATDSAAGGRSFEPGREVAGIFAPWPAELSRVMASAGTATSAMAEGQVGRLAEQTGPLLPPFAIPSVARARQGDDDDMFVGLPSAGAAVPPTFPPSFGSSGRTAQGSVIDEEDGLVGRSPADDQNQASGDRSFIVHTNVLLDGEVIARAVSERIVASMNGPLEGSGGFDPRRSYTPVES